MKELIKIDSINVSTLGLSIGEANTVIHPLFIFVIGVAFYAIFIFKFYRFIASRDIFKLNLQQYSQSFFGIIERILYMTFYIVEYFIIFPFITFFWFSVMALVVMFLSKASVEANLLISMALVAAIRITTYYDEDLSKDLAKMLPFALLGVFLVDVSYFSYDRFIDKLDVVPTLWKQLVYYLFFVILLELLLRVLRTIKQLFTDK